jgi:hypothetical protein
MDAIIKPYEDLRVWQRARRERPGQNATRQEREAFIVADISRCIVLETMVRGWPSFYLDDKEDGAMFEAWANEYRPRVWSLMAQQAEEVGVSLEQLLEDNVVYKVEFNDDLGCTVQPLVLADNAAHAQIHRSQAGAAAVVPLWPRHAPQPLQDAVLAMASSNTQRAECLVDKARSLVDRYTPDLPSAAACLRLALSCNPAEAGRLILAEWAKRLGRDTQEEFDRARHVVHAARLCTEDRYAEASPHVTAYLKVEPRPVGAALVMAALCELMPRGTAVPELNETPGRQRALLEHFEQIAGKSLKDCSEAELHNMAKRNPKVGMLLYDLMSLGQQAQRLSVRVAEEEAQRRALIEQALAHPSAIPVENPSLARAVAEVPDLLRATLEDHCLYVPGRFEDMHRRYVDVAQVVELRSLFEIVHRLNSILHRIERDPNQAQRKAAEEMQRREEANQAAQRAAEAKQQREAELAAQRRREVAMTVLKYSLALLAAAIPVGLVLFTGRKWLWPRLKASVAAGECRQYHRCIPARDEHPDIEPGTILETLWATNWRGHRHRIKVEVFVAEDSPEGEPRHENTAMAAERSEAVRGRWHDVLVAVGASIPRGVYLADCPAGAVRITVTR